MPCVFDNERQNKLLNWTELEIFCLVKLLIIYFLTDRHSKKVWNPKISVTQANKENNFLLEKKLIALLPYTEDLAQ